MKIDIKEFSNGPTLQEVYESQKKFLNWLYFEDRLLYGEICSGLPFDDYRVKLATQRYSDFMLYGDEDE